MLYSLSALCRHKSICYIAAAARSETLYYPVIKYLINHFIHMTLCNYLQKANVMLTKSVVQLSPLTDICH